jgi:hypothetical protein
MRKAPERTGGGEQSYTRYRPGSDCYNIITVLSAKVNGLALRIPRGGAMTFAIRRASLAGSAGVIQAAEARVWGLTRRQVDQ